MTYEDIQKRLQEAQKLLDTIPHVASTSAEDRIHNVHVAIRRALGVVDNLVEEGEKPLLLMFNQLSEEARARAVQQETYKRRNDDDAPRDDIVGRIYIEQDLREIREAIFRTDGSRTDGVSLF